MGHAQLFCFKYNLVLSLTCRYVVRAKAGKKQSSKDATGKAANSAGAALRRYNELALKKVSNALSFAFVLSSNMHLLP